ncbi:MAG: DUF3667 domain-containing protein [Brevundimonas sp.]|uniref:DUF3667 domain-containing protein n=1 Tax=Brevundimonas sp. TaxID=1871086 RepID=UPI00248A05F0|nr:DUF3667 domain-containing protein [Brevundimonas sp.]MDI1325374.1 DUF3667 domain-containing protein [Brevundimonas sp.]
MSGELETAALASGGGWLKWKREHADIPPGTPCANCETPLAGPHCHECGQLAEDFHKSVWKLMVEAVESLLHLDGRLFSTLPGLIRRPGKLTRDYMEGKRASQVAPFRMFLVILLIAFFVGHAAMKAGANHQESTDGDHAASASGRSTNLNTRVIPPGSAAMAEFERDVMADPDLTAAEKQTQLAAARGDWVGFSRNLTADVTAKARANAAEAPKMKDGPDAENLRGFKEWIETRQAAIKDDPERFALIMEIWAHRVAILALPVSALMLTVLFAFNRRFYVFDHVIFSMHSLSFQLLLLIMIMALSVLTPLAWWLLWLAPVHLFLHMKGAYQRSVFGTLARMFVLFTLTTVTFSLLAILWLYLGFNEMAGH